MRHRQPSSDQLLRSYTHQYKRRRQYQSEEEEYWERTGRPLKKKENTREHWHCPFFKCCWDEGMSRLPTLENCPECGHHQQDPSRAPVFQRLSPRRDERNRTIHGNESDEEEDMYHRPRWCPDGLSHTQKRRVQRPRSLEEAEARYLENVAERTP